MSKEIDHNRPRFLGPAVSREHSPTVATDILEIGYETGGPYDGPLVLLLRGWPDDVRGWRGVVPHLEQAGFRWVAPWLRGFGHTRFLSGDTIRDGSAVALAQDAIDLVDLLGYRKFSVVGHDWGARAAYAIAAICPERVSPPLPPLLSRILRAVGSRLPHSSNPVAGGINGIRGHREEFRKSRLDEHYTQCLSKPMEDGAC